MERTIPRSQVEAWMRKAIASAEEHGTPYGAVIVEVPSQKLLIAPNRTDSMGKTAHAEMEVLQQLRDTQWDPSDLVMVSTGEPCPMCMAAIIWCGITEVYCGVPIREIANYHNQIMIDAEQVIAASWSEVSITKGVLRNECLRLLQ